MLSDNKIKTLTTLLAESNQEERLWISGFVSGFIATQSSHISADNKLELPSKVTMVYGTETGNAKKLANDLSAEFRKKGLKIKVVALDQYRLTDLSKEEHFFVIISTQGEGEPPAAAQAFFDFIHQTSDQFIKLKYSVLALGDSSYPQFCQAGIDVDHQLKKIGGQRLLPVQLCDTDYENLAKEWLAQVMLVLQ
jgi:sulfite reductase (NADPH) flavoprotein alpha-component